MGRGKTMNTKPRQIRRNHLLSLITPFFCAESKASKRQLNLPPDIDKHLYERVVTTVAGYTKQKSIKPESRIHHDLEADGMDAYDLMVTLQEQFNVDMTNFVFHIHFEIDDDTGSLFWFSRILRDWRKLNKLDKKIPITVMDMYLATQMKRWPNLSDQQHDTSSK
jgi:acyl carrier protein